MFIMKGITRLWSMALLVGCLGIVTTLPGQGSDCIDLTDLNAPFIHCTYGVYDDPFLYQGVVEGHHHTIITDMSATDLKSGGMLRMIPPGETYSIRLGDQDGATAESISVDISVDTNLYDLLILKYAAVMQDPNHLPEEQPRFTFDILNLQDQPIDTNCLSADFIASSNLGWNWSIGGRAWWKDWTNVGFDLSDFHGQTIRIRLTTRDCKLLAHCGYAYFLLSCGQKSLSGGCGNNSTPTFTAPQGFNYRWFWEDSPSQTLSTERTVSVPFTSQGVLHCWVSQLGKESCGFELSCTVESRYPIAGFDTEETYCPQKIRFLNESFVSNDGVNPDGTGHHCGDVLWNFGDGYTSSAFCPTHKYTQAGDFTVTMVAGLGGFQCTDTVRHTVHIPEDTRVDTLVCDALEWNGDIYTESGVYSHNYDTGGGCDSLVALYLTVVKSDAYEVDTAACDRYVWNDSVYTLSGSYTQVFPRTDRCDSIVTTRLDMNYTPEFGVVGPQYVIGGSEWEFTEHAYTIAIDNPLCHIDTVVWSVDCPNMTVQPIGDGTKARLRVFTLLAPNDSVALHAAATNRCGTEERTFWIHTTYYDVDEQADNVRDLAVFPNPNTGLFTLRMKGFSGHVAITVYNAEGLKVMAWEEDGMPDEAVLPVDCSRLRDGIYTFRVHNETAALAKKIVISR